MEKHLSSKNNHNKILYHPSSKNKQQSQKQQLKIETDVEEIKTNNVAEDIPVEGQEETKQEEEAVVKPLPPCTGVNSINMLSHIQQD